MFGGGFTSCVRAARVEGCIFVELYPSGGTTVDLVGADVDETSLGKVAGCFQQAPGADNVGLEKGGSVLDAAIHMRLRGEVHHGFKPVAEQFSDCRTVGDVTANEVVARIMRDVREAFRVDCVGQLVEIDDFDVAAGL